MKKNNNVDIFICTHKDFEKKVSNEAYKVINSNDIDIPSLPFDDKFYSELYQHKYVCDNVKLKKYVGFCHYRRYFDFMDDIPDMDELFKEYDCIVAKPITYDFNIREQYEMCHNIDDLNIIEDIIKKKYPSYRNACDLFLNGKIFVPYNMFIMKKGDFKKYIKFVFGVLDKYIKIVGTDIEKRIEDNKDKYLKDFHSNDTLEYQYRIGGYLAERLTNIFLMKNFNKMRIYGVNVTEDKYTS